MAIAIKSVPVLKNAAATRFIKNIKVAESKKRTIKFSKQVAVSAKILAKAKL